MLVENMRPGALAKFGLGYDAVSARHPRLVYCSISAFGQDGPRASAGGYDVTVQALSGLMAMTGHPGQAPAKIPVAALDFGSALYARGRDPRRARAARADQVAASGCRPHCSSARSAWLSMHVVTYLLGGEEPGPPGRGAPSSPRTRPTARADGYLVVVGTGGQGCLGKPLSSPPAGRLVDDPRFATNADRVRNAEELRDRARVGPLPEGQLPLGRRPRNRRDRVRARPAALSGARGRPDEVHSRWSAHSRTRCRARAHRPAAAHALRRGDDRGGAAAAPRSRRRARLRPGLGGFDETSAGRRAALLAPDDERRSLKPS